MNISINRDDLLKLLLKVGGIVERRQTLPILGNLLFKVRSDSITVTATDLEVEATAMVASSNDQETDFTAPARKLIDICKALPEGSQIKFELGSEQIKLHSGKSRFTLSTLAARDFPTIDPTIPTQELVVEESVLKRLVNKTQFAMALQDVRYYLNGLLLEASNGWIRTVATDGHRLALCESNAEDYSDLDLQIILPRKAVLELDKLLATTDNKLRLFISSNHVRIEFGDIVFVSKLIDGRFPDYERVIPLVSDKLAKVDRELLRQALTRASILSNEKYKGVRFRFDNNSLKLLAHNPEQEEAEDELDIAYQAAEQSVGFNVGYLIDVLGAIEEDEIEIGLADSNNSALLSGIGCEDCKYVVMPMRI